MGAASKVRTSPTCLYQNLVQQHCGQSPYDSGLRKLEQRMIPFQMSPRISFFFCHVVNLQCVQSGSPRAMSARTSHVSELVFLSFCHHVVDPQCVQSGSLGANSARTSMSSVSSDTLSLLL